MATNHMGAPVGYGFCDKHGEMVGGMVEVKAICQATREIAQNLHDSIMPMLQGTDCYPVVLKRVADLEAAQRQQVLIGKQTADTLAGIQTALATKSEERRLTMDRSTKITVALIAATMTLLSGAIASGAAVWAAHHATVTSVAATGVR